MPNTEEPQSASARPRRRRHSGSDKDSITPVLPLLLLETMRDMDRPEEVLEDEDLSVSMPRRFGLSDVVGAQIRRFQEEVRRGQLQSAAVVEDLMRLVIRRPDADAIFLEAGRRVAWHAWEARTAMVRGSVRVLPHPAALMAARRAARRLFKQLAGPGRLSIRRWPAELRIAGSITAAADPGGAACALYSGALAELLHQYTGQIYRVAHPRCEATGADTCEWMVQAAQQDGPETATVAQ